MTDYAPSPVDWVREEVEFYERTGAAADGRRVVVLWTTGRTTGLTRKSPLMRVESLGVLAVVASKGGADEHPAWYLNILADPLVQLQDGLERHNCLAREVHGKERAGWWSVACTAFPSYADYQSKSRRKIPVVVLERTD